MRESIGNTRSRFGVLLILLMLLAGAFLVLSCEETTGPGEETPSDTKKLLIYTDASSIPANGGSAQITVKVYADDDTTNVLSGVKVDFSAVQAGTKLYIQALNDITDDKGLARATLYAGTRAGTAAVTASMANFSNTVFVSVTAGVGLLSAEPSSILADGVSKSTLTATVIDSLGQPLPGAKVSFTASSGTVTAQSYSNENGKATAVLTSVASVTDISSTVTANTESGTVAKIAVDDEEAPDDTPAVGKTAATEGLIGTTTVVFRGITITSEIPETTLYANNADSTLITTTVKETTSGDPVSGVTLTYSTTLGAVRLSEGVTDSKGQHSVVFFGGNVAGTPVFSVKLHEGLSYSSQLSLIKQLYMVLEAKPSVLSSNGNDLATVMAFLHDADNNPIEGETVYFSTSLGTILKSAVTNEWGEASVSLRSPRFNCEAVVTARYGTLEKSTYVKFIGSDIQLFATPLVLVADGESRSRLTVNLSDASGSALVDDKVTITTSIGTLISADEVSRGVSIVDSTSTEGKITAYLTSTEAGTALVKFIASGIRDSLEVDFTDYTFSLSSSLEEVLAGGEEFEVTATLRDKNGAITPLEAEDVEFSATLGTITSIRKSPTGTVIATLSSGNNAGSSTVTASILDPAVSASTTVTFVAAKVGSVTLEPSKNFVRMGGNTVQIVARVFDESGNPKSGETVTFSLVKGPGGGEKLDVGTAVTNEIGQAIVNFISGMTGSEQNGIEIHARVGTISGKTSLTITGNPESVTVGFDTGNFKTNDDGTFGLLVSAIVSDVNRNKVVDGTIVNFSISGNVGVIDPEVGTVDGVASTTLIYSASDAGKTIQVTASSGGKLDTKSVTLPGAVGTVATMKTSVTDAVILADGVATSVITISLTGTKNEPLSEVTVYCTTDIGTINPTAVTGDPSDPNAAPGIARAVYRSLASHEDKTATITITAGEITETVQIQLKGITLTAVADPDIVPSDGQSRSKIDVLIKETTSHIPIIGEEVFFGVSDGHIGGRAKTDENGVATTTFTSGYDSGVSHIYVIFGSTLVDTLDVTISDVTARGIDLFANPTQIAANGSSVSTISALLRDDNFNPIVGETIRFTTTLGTITSADSTDEKGRAEVKLESERRNGQAIVTARFKEHVKTIPVNFTGVKISVSATPENLFAGGDEQTEITAYLKDAAEVPIVGEEVLFEWFMGSEKMPDQKATTDTQGKASIFLSSAEYGEANIRVSGAGAVDSTRVEFTRFQFTIKGEAESVATGNNRLKVDVELYDTVNDKYIEDAQVYFYTTNGSVDPISAVTDSKGTASTDLISGSTAGALTVSASAMVEGSRVSAEKEFTFVNAPADTVTLKVDANIVAVGGNSSAIIATVLDEYGNPVSDALVSFKIVQGPAGGEYIRPPTVTTGTSGVATSYFYSGQVPSEFEGVHLIAEVAGETSDVVTLTIAGAPELIKPSFLSDWDLDTINNSDGTYTLPISATVLDVNSNGVVDGTTVYFKIEPAEGAVLSPVKTVNSVAVSSITYPSASSGREVKLTASAGGKEGSITFSLPGFMVSYLSLSVSPKSIPADGKSTTTIKATLFDKNGSSTNVPDGTTVSFATDGGTVDPVVTKTVGGVAYTTLTSDKTARYVTIEAQSGLFTDLTVVLFEEIGSSVNQVSDIELRAFDEEGNENPTIQADGFSTAVVRAKLLKHDGEPVTMPTTVAFESDIGQITSFVRSDTTGYATATFSSGEVGTATINATVGNAIGFASVIVEPGEPRSIELSFTSGEGNPSVYVKGSGKNETLLVTASVKDSKHNSVKDGHLVQFELVGDYDTTSSISPQKTDNQYMSTPVPTLNGVATVSFHAGTKAGAMRLKATVVDENEEPIEPLVSSETTQFLVYGGPPFLDTTDSFDPFTNSRIKIYTGPINIYAGAIGSDENKATITATVADKFNNPVPPGTAIYFTTTGGYITNATGYTDENGMATVVLYSGNPFPTLLNSSSIENPNYQSGDPPGEQEFNVEGHDFDGDGTPNDGIAVVIARTEGLDQDGKNVTVWNYGQVVFSLPVGTFTVTTDKTILNLGETATITVRIYDINGNPVVNASTISFSSASGELSTSSITTGDPGRTSFQTTLTNDLNPNADSKTYTVVSVRLTSPNGNITAESQPILLTLDSM